MPSPTSSLNTFLNNYYDLILNSPPPGVSPYGQLIMGSTYTDHTVGWKITTQTSTNSGMKVCLRNTI